MNDRTHPDSGKLDGPGIVPGLRAEIERLRAELADARRTAEYWKAEHLASNAELDALKRNNSYCPMCGSGTVPSVPAPAQEPCGWQFYQDGRWHNGMETNDHRKHTEAAGFPVRDVYPGAPATLPAPAQPMCGAGTVPSVPDDEALLRQALEALDPCDGVRWGGMGKVRAAAIKALRERLK